uniref:TEP1-F n=1 Tax=Romanomermis culicivorax TaxID=13658 RepID=A0A915JB76_ROMCU
MKQAPAFNMLPNINLLLFYAIALFPLSINNVVSQSTTTTVSSTLYRGTYLIVAPKTVRPGLPYAISVNILQNAAPVTLTMKIVDSDNKSYAQKVQEDLKAGSPVTVKIDKVPNTLSSGVSYNLYVKGESSGNTLFEQSNYLYFNDKSFSTFIQTDKAIYKPGSTIHIRIVAVYPDLKPYKGAANIKITDPNRNVVQQFSNATIDKGVIGKKDSLSLSLVEEPPLGDWTISCDIDGTKTEKQFTVDKYVLPKFDVTVKPPPYLITTDDLMVTVSSKYTYGKGVEGSATLYIQRPYYFGDDRQRMITRTQDLDKNGDSIFKITNSALNEVQLMDPYGGSLKMVATVTEKLTGTQRNGTADVTIYRQKYKLTVSKPSETYLPGLDYAVSIALTTQDDKPSSVPNDKTIVNITTTYTFPYAPPPPNTTNWVSIRERVDNLLLPLNNDGTLTYVAKTSPGSNNLRLDVRYGPESDPITTSLYVDASKSPSQSYLQVTTDKTSVKAGETVTFNINTTFDLPTLTVQVMTRGYMVFIKNVNVKNRAAQVKIPTTAEMAPKARLIVYGVRPDNKEIVVSAMDLKVDGLLQNKVSISVDPTRTEPGKNVTFTINASPTSYIGLLSVDQSVLLLKSGNDITKSQVESDIAQYDTTGYSGRWWGPFNRQKRMICWGCGWWGIGGKDAATIFEKILLFQDFYVENSGVIVMTDAYLYREPIPIEEIALQSQESPSIIALAANRVDNGGDGLTMASSRIRTKFPELWIWMDDLLNK